jgi:predicted nucleic acid-binding protein
MMVLDASAVIDLLLDRQPAADEVRRRLRADSDVPAAPFLLDAEVGQVLRRFVLAGLLDSERAAGALEDLADLRIDRYPHVPLLPRAFDFRDNTTFYDGLYLALAEALEAPLVTLDSALTKIPGHHAIVVLV